MSLTEYQIKDAQLIEDRLDKIQEFVNENIINKNESMTKTKIYAGLGALVSDLDEDKFGRAFSSSIKLGKITGIVSAKRAGFRSKTHVSETKENVLADKLEEIQQLVNDKLSKKKSFALQELFEDLKLEGVDESIFRVAFSSAVKNGEIVGVKGVRGVGFVAASIADSVSISKPPQGDDDWADTEKTSIMLGKKYRLYAVDKRNWALQKDNDGNWISWLYWPDLDGALRGVAKAFLNKEIKNIGSDLNNIKEIINLIHESEKRIYEKLSGLVEDNEPETDLEQDSEVA